MNERKDLVDEAGEAIDDFAAQLSEQELSVAVNPVVEESSALAEETIRDTHADQPDEEQPQQPEDEKILNKPNFLCKFTIDGEVLVKVTPFLGHKDAKYEVMPLKTVPLLGIPSFIKDKHIRDLQLIYDLVTTIKEKYPKRSLPVTNTEYEKSGGSKSSLKDLCKAGFVKKYPVAVVGSNNKNSGSRSCVYFTPQGRALVRDKIDPNYALTDYQ